MVTEPKFFFHSLIFWQINEYTVNYNFFRPLISLKLSQLAANYPNKPLISPIRDLLKMVTEQKSFFHSINFWHKKSHRTDQRHLRLIFLSYNQPNQSLISLIKDALKMVTEKIFLVVKNLVYKIIPEFAYFALPVYREESSYGKFRSRLFNAFLIEQRASKDAVAVLSIQHNLESIRTFSKHVK